MHSAANSRYAKGTPNTPPRPTTSEVASALGVGPAMLRHRVRRLGLQLATERRRAGMYTKDVATWTPAQIETLRAHLASNPPRSPEAVAARAERKRQRAAAAAERARVLEAERQQNVRDEIARLNALDTEALIARALACLHALNRQAKHERDRFRHDAKEKIYRLKDRFLEAMTLAGRATVGSFEYVHKSNERTCSSCGRWWVGDAFCLTCDAWTGEAADVRATWHLVDCGDGYRFHQPRVSASVARVATPIVPHDPHQPARDVPDVGLHPEAQHHCVERAISILQADPPAVPDAPFCGQGTAGGAA